MIYLLDTHVLIQYVEEDRRLSEKIISLIENEDNQILVSNASLWELAIKISIGKLNISISLTELESFLQNYHFEIFPFSFKHLEQLLLLPFHHNDPFDRLIIAQAISENYQVITDDNKFKYYDVRLVN